MAPPKRITRAQFKAMGGVIADSPEPKKISRAEFEAMGGKIQTPPGEHVSESLTESGGLSHGPGTAFGLNALDSLSMVGVPTVLGGLDAVRGIDSADSESKGKFSIDSLTSAMDRYRKNKEFYEGGMKRLKDTNPKSAFAGQMAPMAIPGGQLLKGAKLGKTMAFGAGQGAVSGLLRGNAKTADLTPEALVDTAIDTGVGATIGAGTAGAGYGLGKAAGAPAAWLAKKAKGGLEKFRGKAEAKVRSEIGELNQVQGEGIGGLGHENSRIAKVKELEARLAARREAKNAGPVPGQTRADRAPVHSAGPETKGVEGDLELAGRAVVAAKRAKDQAKDNLKRFGGNASPRASGMFRQAEKDVRQEMNNQIKTGLKDAAVAGVAGAIHPAAGVVLGVQKMGSLRDAARAVGGHPALLNQVIKMAPVQQALARFGGKAGAIGAHNAQAMLYALGQKDPEVAEALRMAASEGSPRR